MHPLQVPPLKLGVMPRPLAPRFVFKHGSMIFLQPAGTGGFVLLFLGGFSARTSAVI